MAVGEHGRLCAYVVNELLQQWALDWSLQARRCVAMVERCRF